MAEAVITQDHASDHRTHLVREAATMVLYVSVVEIAELAAIPEDHFAHGRVTGPVGGALLAIVWGTAVGLAIAHWFAFRIAAPAFRRGEPDAPRRPDRARAAGRRDVRGGHLEPSRVCCSTTYARRRPPATCPP